MTREAALIEMKTPPAMSRILALASDIAERVSRPLASKVDQEALWPGESLCALGGAGLLGLNVPRRAGGLGEGLVALSKVTEILGGACSSTSMCFGMHCVATAVIAAKATPHQEATYLRAIAAGRHVTSLALSEAGTGAHFYLPRATFRREGDSFVIDGDKSFITSAGHADCNVFRLVETDEYGRLRHFVLKPRTVIDQGRALRGDRKMLGLPNIGGMVLDHMIVAAERTLADYKAGGLLPTDKVRLFEGLVAKMYDERRAFLEDMMQLPFVSARSDA